MVRPYGNLCKCNQHTIQSAETYLSNIRRRHRCRARAMDFGLGHQFHLIPCDDAIGLVW